jgi:3-hydroxybutyryl-CoA dehydrogenase
MKTIAVIGAGTMGSGIAQVAAMHGCTVYLHDADDKTLRRSIEGLSEILTRLFDRGKLTRADREACLERIKTIDTFDQLRDAGIELAIEAVVEDAAVKRNVFAALDEALPDSTLLASNTSSLSISQLAEAVRNPSRVVGMHFFNPAPAMKLVEVIAGDATDESAVDAAFKAAKDWGKIAVRVKDTPGFLVNRIARGYYLEAFRLLGEGVAGVDEIDGVMRLLGKFRQGPFELMDRIGLDVNLAATTSIWERLGRPARMAPHELHQKLVAQGHHGRKTGRGCYLYDGEPPLPALMVDRRTFELSPLLADVMAAFSARAGAPRTGSTERFIFGRILGAIINEAGLVFSEGIATGGDIDEAMVRGVNYPKGPLAWADDVGHRTVRGLLKALNDSVRDGRYAPAPLFAAAE